MLELRSVSKAWGATSVLDRVSLSVTSGLNFLVGRNGAGKTTLIRIALGLVSPDAGEVRLFGQNPLARPQAARDAGILLEKNELFEFLTPLEFLDYCAALRGLDGRSARTRALDLLEEFEVPPSDRLCRELSTGMARQVGLAAALLHQPKLLVLDEPFRGLDPLATDRLCGLLQRFAEGGGAALIASHRLSRIEEIADSVWILRNGRATRAPAGSAGTWAREFLASEGTDPVAGSDRTNPAGAGRNGDQR